MASRPEKHVWLGGATLKDLVAWNDRLWNTGNSSNINLSFASAGFFTPFAMLFVVHQVRLFRTQFPEVRFTISDFDHLSYPAHMGFFTALGADYGKETGEAPGDLNYLPVTVMRTREFLEQNGFNRINEAVDLEAARLARVLTRRGSGPTFQLVQYSLREIMRNVFEHSGSKILTFCAQCWRNSNRV